MTVYDKPFLKIQLCTALWLNWDETELIIYKKDNYLECFYIPCIVLRQILLHIHENHTLHACAKNYAFMIFLFVCLLFKVKFENVPLSISRIRAPPPPEDIPTHPMKITWTMDLSPAPLENIPQYRISTYTSRWL